MIGSQTDSHVELVLRHLPRNGTVVVDAETVSTLLHRFDAGQWLVHDLDGEVVLVDAQTRGWVRRLAPAGWDDGAAIGSHAAARLTARLALLGALMRAPGPSWLTTVDALAAAENKLAQYTTARQASVPVPRTVMSVNSCDVARALGEPFVVKPLGVGRFARAGEDRVVFAEAVTAADLDGVDLLDAPFVMQEAIDARAHLRVVTVLGEVWACELDARELPMDWRRADGGHSRFRATSSYPAVEAQAMAVAEVMSVGFSSQDWVVGVDQAYFLDLNPAGQWAFLPPEVETSVTSAVATWLRGA